MTRSPRTPGRRPSGAAGRGRLSTRALFAIFRRHPGAGVGIVLGPAAGVVDLEVDDREQAGPLLAELFPGGPPLTMGWSSSRGEHRLFLWDDRLAGRALRWSTWLAAPSSSAWDRAASSSGPSALPRRAPTASPRWNGVWEIAPCPEVLIAVVARMADAQVPRVRPCECSGRGGEAYPEGMPSRRLSGR